MVIKELVIIYITFKSTETYQFVKKDRCFTTNAEYPIAKVRRIRTQELVFADP